MAACRYVLVPLVFQPSVEPMFWNEAARSACCALVKQASWFMFIGWWLCQAARRGVWAWVGAAMNRPSSNIVVSVFRVVFIVIAGVGLAEGVRFSKRRRFSLKRDVCPEE